MQYDVVVGFFSNLFNKCFFISVMSNCHKALSVSNKGTVYCSMKHLESLIEFEPTTDKHLAIINPTH